MNDLINTTTQTPIEIALGIDEDGRTTAKKLYEFLELDKTHYTRWYKANITENEFAEFGTDYIVLAIDGENPQGGRPTQDFKLTAAFAKKLSMTAKSEKGEQARNYFVKTEEKLKEIARKPISYLDILKNATLEISQKVDSVDNDLQAFKQDMPILGIEESRITAAVRKKGVNCLGGKQSEAYKDNSIRSKVYSDIYGQIKRQFGVDTYKAIKRSQCETAVSIIEGYELPMILAEEIDTLNSPRNWDGLL